MSDLVPPSVPLQSVWQKLDNLKRVARARQIQSAKFVLWTCDSCDFYVCYKISNLHCDVTYELLCDKMNCTVRLG